MPPAADRKMPVVGDAENATLGVLVLPSGNKPGDEKTMPLPLFDIPNGPIQTELATRRRLFVGLHLLEQFDLAVQLQESLIAERGLHLHLLQLLLKACPLKVECDAPLIRIG